MISLLDHLDRLARWLAYVAGAVLVALALLTVAAAAMRYLFNAPILGILDVSKMALVVVVFFAVAYCGRSGGHVAVDLFTDMLGRRVTRWTDGLVRLAGAVIFGVITWRCVVGARQAAEFLEATDTLDIPHAPFFIVIAVGAALYGLILLLEGLIVLTGRDPAPDQEG